MQTTKNIILVFLFGFFLATIANNYKHDPIAITETTTFNDEYIVIENYAYAFMTIEGKNCLVDEHDNKFCAEKTTY